MLISRSHRTQLQMVSRAPWGPNAARCAWESARQSSCPIVVLIFRRRPDFLKHSQTKSGQIALLHYFKVRIARYGLVFFFLRKSVMGCRQNFKRASRRLSTSWWLGFAAAAAASLELLENSTWLGGFLPLKTGEKPLLRIIPIDYSWDWYILPTWKP